MVHNNRESSFSADELSDWFWDIIDAAGGNIDHLSKMLSEMSESNIIHFDKEFREAATELTIPPFRDYVEYPSEDNTQDIAEWVVSRGKTFFTSVLKDPSKMPSEIKRGGLATFGGVADKVFISKFKRSIP